MTETPSDHPPTHRLAIRRPVTMVMIFLTLAVFGWQSYRRLPINLMPDISYPTLTVRTEMEGAAPEDVEKLVTRPLEETLSIVGGMVEISSVSSPDLSEIIMEFTWGTDMNTALQDVRDRLDLFVPPQEVTEKPVILRYDPTLDPVLRVAIAGRGLNDAPDEAVRRQRSREELIAIRDAVERHVKSDLEAEAGIAQVVVKGGSEEEIQVRLDSDKLNNLGISPLQVTTILAQQNIDLSGGRLKEGKTEYQVRTKNEYEDVRQIGETILGSRMGLQVRLKDVAEVTIGEKERDTIVRINGQEAVELEIHKEGDANTVHVCDKVKALLGFERPLTLADRLDYLMRSDLFNTARDRTQMEEEMRKRAAAKTLKSHLPEYAQIKIMSDQSRFITAAVQEVQSATIYGGILALAVLYFFLRDWKSTFSIGVAIPISIVATFIPMFIQGITLNIMSLGGLALGVGMLVDNSIVVLESIFRCKEEGDDPVHAADRGTREVFSAVIAATLTTVCVFLPLAFVEGVAGQLFSDQALTVTYSLMASLFVALYLNPMIASRGKLALPSTGETIWLLRAYAAARAEARQGALEAAVLTLPYSLRLAVEWFRESRARAFAPITVRKNRAAGRQGGRWSKILLLAEIATRPLLCGVIGALFAGQVVLKALSAMAVLGFVPLFLLGMGLLWALRKALAVVLWLPLRLFDRIYHALVNMYTTLLRHALDYSLVTILLIVVITTHSFFIATRLGRELIPPLKQGEFGIRLETPPGTRLEETARRAQVVEALALAIPEIDTVSLEIGKERSKAMGQRGENIATFTVLLKDPERAAARQDAVMDRLRSRIREVSSDAVTFTLPILFSFKTAVELHVRGDDPREIKRIGKDICVAIADVPGLKDVELSMKEGYPEVIIELDRDLLAARNLDIDQVARRLRTEIQGDVATRFDRAGTKVDIRVRAAQTRLASLHDLYALSVADGSPPTPLSSVARISVQEGPSEVRRIGQRPVAVITANVEGRDLAAVSQEILARARRLQLPKGYDVVPGGQYRELKTSYESLVFALCLAIFLVYVVMACQFESLVHPALVMFAVPLGFIGVVYGLYLFSIDLSVIVFLGAMILAGVVVNDAIVLVDYINQLRGRGMRKRDALVLAARVRVRPILMTSVTTVLGLLPMALWTGAGAEIRRPLAITVMAGLSSSTLLTLVIIPMLYELFGGRDKP